MTPKEKRRAHFNRLMERLLQDGWSQVEIAEKVSATGMMKADKGRITNLKNSRSSITEKTISAFQKAFGSRYPEAIYSNDVPIATADDTMDPHTKTLYEEVDQLWTALKDIHDEIKETQELLKEVRSERGYTRRSSVEDFKEKYRRKRP